MQLPFGPREHMSLAVQCMRTLYQSKVRPFVVCSTLLRHMFQPLWIPRNDPFPSVFHGYWSPPRPTILHPISSDLVVCIHFKSGFVRIENHTASTVKAPVTKREMKNTQKKGKKSLENASKVVNNMRREERERKRSENRRTQIRNPTKLKFKWFIATWKFHWVFRSHISHINHSRQINVPNFMWGFLLLLRCGLKAFPSTCIRGVHRFLPFATCFLTFNHSSSLCFSLFLTLSLLFSHI